MRVDHAGSHGTKIFNWRQAINKKFFIEIRNISLFKIVYSLWYSFCYHRIFINTQRLAFLNVTINYDSSREEQDPSLIWSFEKIRQKSAIFWVRSVNQNISPLFIYVTSEEEKRFLSFLACFTEECFMKFNAFSSTLLPFLKIKYSGNVAVCLPKFSFLNMWDRCCCRAHCQCTNTLNCSITTCLFRISFEPALFVHLSKNSLRLTIYRWY